MVKFIVKVVPLLLLVPNVALLTSAVLPEEVDMSSVFTFEYPLVVVLLGAGTSRLPLAVLPLVNFTSKLYVPIAKEFG